MALDNLTTAGLKTVYALSNQPLSSGLKKELETKLNNFKKNNLSPSTVVPFTPEYLSELKKQDLLVVQAAEKAKNRGIGNWVFLSITVATVALAILAPLILLPLAGVLGILTITVSILYIKSLTDKNKAITNLANSVWNNLPKLAKIEENRKTEKESPFAILSRIPDIQINPPVTSNSKPINNSSDYPFICHVIKIDAETPMDNQPHVRTTASKMAMALNASFAECYGFNQNPRLHFQDSHPIIKNLVKFFNHDPYAKLNLQILTPILRQQDDQLGLYNHIANVFEWVRISETSPQLSGLNESNLMHIMTDPTVYIELTDPIRLSINNLCEEISHDNTPHSNETTSHPNYYNSNIASAHHYEAMAHQSWSQAMGSAHQNWGHNIAIAHGTWAHNMASAHVYRNLANHNLIQHENAVNQTNERFTAEKSALKKKLELSLVFEANTIIRNILRLENPNLSEIKSDLFRRISHTFQTIQISQETMGTLAQKIINTAKALNEAR